MVLEECKVWILHIAFVMCGDFSAVSPTGMILNSLLGLFPTSRRTRVRLRVGEKPFCTQSNRPLLVQK
jgi:hypothetical protein